MKHQKPSGFMNCTEKESQICSLYQNNQDVSAHVCLFWFVSFDVMVEFPLCNQWDLISFVWVWVITLAVDEGDCYRWVKVTPKTIKDSRKYIIFCSYTIHHLSWRGHITYTKGNLIPRTELLKMIWTVCACHMSSRASLDSWCTWWGLGRLISTDSSGVDLFLSR